MDTFASDAVKSYNCLMFLNPNHKFETLNLIEIEKKALLNNFAYFQKLHPSSKICPVLKSNAYGHGLKTIGNFVYKEINPEFICVDSLYEAYELEKLGVKSKILIMGWTFPENFKFRKIDFRLPVFDMETIKCLSKYQPKIKVHLKIDTGMNRLGIKENDYESFAEELKKSNVVAEGIYSHLSDADNFDEKFTKLQIQKFKNAVRFFENSGFDFKWKHLYATAGATKYPDNDFNLIRLGLGFYGISPFFENSKYDKVLEKSLIPALTFKTHLIEVKRLKKGETVGYSRTFKAKHSMDIGLLPLGYYDGLDRNLSNKGSVEIQGRNCPIIGNVCMNIIAIDLTAVEKSSLGMEVLVFNNKSDSPNSIKKSAGLAKTIPYVLLANLAETTKRILV